MMRPADSSDPVIRLGLLMQETMGLVHRRSAGRTWAIMSDVGLTMPQVVTLHILRLGGAQSIHRIAEALSLSTSAASHLVGRLFEKGLVDRREDPEDRRQKRVELTDAGIGLVDELASERLGEFTQALSQLDPELVSLLVSVLEKTIEQLAAGLPDWRQP